MATTVKESVFADYFEDVGSHRVLLLSEVEAQHAWTEQIDANATSYFDLPDASWVVSSPQRSLGNWIDAYNSDDRPTGTTMLKGAVDWPDDAAVLFFAKKSTALRTDWSTFCALWDDFLAVEDDCSLLVTEDDTQALLFRPIGDVVKIN